MKLTFIAATAGLVTVTSSRANHGYVSRVNHGYVSRANHGSLSLPVTLGIGYFYIIVSPVFTYSTV